MTYPSRSQLVGYLVNQYPKGSHTFVRREIRALEALGFRVTRVSVRRSGEPMTDAADAEEAAQTRVILEAGAGALLMGVLLTALAVPLLFCKAVALAIRVGRRSEKGRLYHLVYLAEACLLRRWLRRGGVGHVHAHFGTNSATVAMLAAALGGVTYSFTIHGPEEFDKAPLLSLAEKVARARFVAVISHFGRSQLYRLCRSEDWDKVVIVPCGLDASFLDESPVPVPPQGGLVCVGRLSEQKGHVSLCKSIAALANEGTPLSVTFIGDGELRGLVEATIAEHNLQGQVTLAGWKDTAGVKAALQGARALVLPSFAEGLPVVIMEALAMGRPVITTYVAGIPELVEHGKNGWLVAASDTGALAAAMKAALQTESQTLLKMGTEGRARVLQRHNIQTSARLLAALFNAANATPAQVAQIFQAHVTSAMSKP
ncbi:MAG: glycosyltransferase [Deltaproteobacteria bacterium]|nr:glycosyltransferase [Deltaproteobacteria bacterium]